MFPTESHSSISTPVAVAPIDAPQRLSAREHNLVRALARGLSNRQIAQEFHLSEQTVKNQLTAIYQKVGIRSRLQLAVYAMRHDLA